MYKKGDKVRVRKLVPGSIYGNVTALNGMAVLSGKVVTISMVNRISYKIAEDKYGYYWSGDMFEPVNNKQTVTAKECESLINNASRFFDLLTPEE